MKFIDLPIIRFSQVLDQYPSTVIELGLAQGFSQAMIEEMEDNQFGGGKPHARFIELINSKNFSIDQVRDAMITVGINEMSVREKFLVADEKHYNRFKQLTPREIQPFFRLVREDRHNPNQPSWKNVAEKLGMSDSIGFLSGTIAQGGCYSIGDAFCHIVTCMNLSIKEFKEVLENHLVRLHEEGDCTTEVEEIFEVFTKAIEMRLRQLEK